jgi:hypothetical protein
MSHGKITISVQMDTKQVARMVKQAGLVGDRAGHSEAASVLQPLMRATMHDWVPALIEEACNRMLKAREEL